MTIISRAVFHKYLRTGGQHLSMQPSKPVKLEVAKKALIIIDGIAA